MTEWYRMMWYELLIAWTLDGGLDPDVMAWLHETAMLLGVCDVWRCWT